MALLLFYCFSRISYLCLFFLNHTCLTLSTLAGADLTVVSLHFFLESLILHWSRFIWGCLGIFVGCLFYLRYRVEDYLLIAQCSKRYFTVISWLDRYVKLGPIKLSIGDLESFTWKMEYNFAQSNLSVFLKLRYIYQKSLLNIIFIDKCDSSALFWPHCWIMTKLIVVDAHLLFELFYINSIILVLRYNFILSPYQILTKSIILKEILHKIPIKKLTFILY